MSVSKYKKWMTESFLYEDKDVMNQDIETKDGKKVKVKTAYDNPDHELHKKAKAMVDKANGGDDKEKKKPVSIDIDAGGGLGGDDEPKGEPEEKQSDNDITNLNKKPYSELMDMDIKDLDDAVEEGEREAEQLEPEIDDLVKKHNEEFPKGKRPLALGGQLLPREKQKDPELYDRWKASMDAINEKKKRLESVKSGIDRVKEIADDKVSEEKKNDAIGAIESDGVDAIIDKFKESGKEEIYIDDDEGNEHSVVYDDLSPEMQKQLRKKLKPMYDKVKAAQEKMDSLDVDDPGYDDAEQEYELAMDAAGGLDTYEFEQMFDFVTERISRKGESIKTINGKKYKAIKESKHPLKEQYDRLFTNKVIL